MDVQPAGPLPCGTDAGFGPGCTVEMPDADRLARVLPMEMVVRRGMALRRAKHTRLPRPVRVIRRHWFVHGETVALGGYATGILLQAEL